MFSVCPHLKGGGRVPRPGPDEGGGGVVPHQTWPGGGGTPPRISHIRPGRGEGVPLPKGYPPWVTDGVLDTPQSVCLLPSHRRTFLFSVKLTLLTKKSSCMNTRGIPTVAYQVLHPRWGTPQQRHPLARSDGGPEVGYLPPGRGTPWTWPGTPPHLDLAGVPLPGVDRQTDVKTGLTGGGYLRWGTPWQGYPLDLAGYPPV